MTTIPNLEPTGVHERGLPGSDGPGGPVGRRGRPGWDRGDTVTDLVWLTGYQPTAITERLTMLVLRPDQEPTLLVPVLERPDAQSAEGRRPSIVDWADGTDPYPVACALLQQRGRFGISDSAWALHLPGLQGSLLTGYQPLTECLPMMRR